MRRAWLLVAVGLILGACGGAGDTSDTPVTTETAASSSTASPAPAETAPPTTASADTEATTTTTTTAVTTTEPSQDDAPRESSETVPVPPPSEDAPVPAGFETLVAAARADLASRLSVAEAEIRVALVESVVWPDSSVGCPQPDMAYTQVQVDGFRIMLEHGESSYAYHGGGARPDPFLCRNPN